MLGQSNLVDLSLVLEVFGEDELVNSDPVLGLALQTLLNDHVEVFGDALRNRIVLLVLNFLLKFFNVVRVVGILVGTHLIGEDAKGPHI